MIVRIMGEGQYDLDGEGAETLERLDHQLFEAIEGGDDATFATVLAEALETVRSIGTLVDPATIVPSDLTLPHPHATLDEVRQLLSSDDSQEA
jgi:hypothetical protein